MLGWAWKPSPRPSPRDAPGGSPGGVAVGAAGEAGAGEEGEECWCHTARVGIEGMRRAGLAVSRAAPSSCSPHLPGRAPAGQKKTKRL